MSDVNIALSKELNALDHDELLDTAEIFKASLQDCHCEKLKLEVDLRDIKADHKQLLSQRVSSFPSSTSSAELQPYWIRAEVDCPTETSWSCFREKSKYRTVIVFDQKVGSLKARNRDSVKGETAGIYSRLPSRSCKTFHVFHECSITSATKFTTQEKFWVSTKVQAPTGYIPYCTIHFSRLSWKTRFSIWTGRVKWLYILPRPEFKEKG